MSNAAFWADLARNVANDPRAKRIALKGVTLAQRKFRASRPYKKAQQKIQSIVQIGETPGTSNTLTVQNRSDGEVPHSTNTMYSINCLQVPRLSNTFSLSSRLRDTIYLSGFKICMVVENLRTAAGQNLFFNYALVSNRGVGFQNPPTNDWFRTYNGAARSTDFGDATLTALDRHCQPINTDQYYVHFHNRSIIKQGEIMSVSGPKEYAKVMVWEKYIPVNRQIRFDSQEADASETKFYLVYWAGTQGDTIAASQTPVTLAFSLEHKILACFRDNPPMYAKKYRK